MEPKKRRRRSKYTLMILSDSMEEGVKQVYLGSKRFRFLKVLLAVILIAGICYCVYNPIVMSGIRTINRSQTSQIKQLKEENAALEEENKGLTDKISILSETINQKVQTEEAQAAKMAELSIPKGFPLTGAATIQEAEQQEAEDGAAGALTEAGEEQDTQDAEGREEELILVFKGTEGNMVVASGSGTVAAVESDEAYGNKVTIDHGNGYQSIYRNAGEARVKTGDEVVRGTAVFVIGEANTGLGYQIIKDGTYINPEDIVEISG